MDFKKLFKLSKALLKLAKVQTDKAELIVDGDIVVGVEVFVEGEDGELVVPEDGEYVTEEQKITIKEGKVEVVEPIEPEEKPEEEVKEEIKEEVKEEMACEPKQKMEEEQPEEQPEEPVKEELDEKDERIAELEGLLKDRDAIVEELTAKIKELEGKLAEPAEEPVKMSKMYGYKNTVKENPVLKYFDK